LEVEMSKKCTPLARSTFASQNAQNTSVSDHVWKLRCRKSARRCGAKHISKSKCTKHTILKKVHDVVARSTFRSQNVQNTSVSDRFWKLRCRKSARRCGEKHISKSKCTKHHMFAALLEVQMSKKCTPLWREAHFEVKMLKAPGFRTTFGGSDVASLHYIALHYTPLHYTALHCTITLHYATLRLQLHNYTTTLHYTPLHSTTFHYTPLHSTTLHYTPLHSTTLHYTKSHYTTLHYITLHSTALHYTTLHYTTLHYLPLHFTTLHYTTLHYTTLHYTTLPSTTLHYITLHYTPLHYKYYYECTTTLHYTPLQ